MADGTRGHQVVDEDDPAFIVRRGDHMCSLAMEHQPLPAIKGRGTRDRWDNWMKEPQPLLERVLDGTPFAGLLTLRFHNNDANRMMLAALCERWRDETHTFQLPCGEWGITPLDIYMQIGFPFHGAIVPQVSSLAPLSSTDWLRLVGDVPPEGEFQGHQVKMRWFYNNFASVVPTTEREALHKARAMITYAFGSFLFCHANERVDPKFLRLVEDLHHPYNWNGAILTRLFQGLDKTCRHSRSFTGFWPVVEVPLLSSSLEPFASFLSLIFKCTFIQTCFYDHFPHLAPRMRDDIEPSQYRHMYWHQQNRQRNSRVPGDNWRADIDGLTVEDVSILFVFVLRVVL